METLVPNRYLMQFEIPIHYRDPGIQVTADVDRWDDAYLLPDLGALEDDPDYAYVWMAWNEKGFSIACYVDEKTKPPRCVPNAFWKGDNLRLMTDMPDTRDIKRATRFFQHFYVLPRGGGGGGTAPVAANVRINGHPEHGRAGADYALPLPSTASST